MYPQTSAVIFKRRIYEEIGGYDESRRYCEDGQFFMKVCDKYNYYYHPDKVVVFDGGKRGFGAEGLSGNLKAMHESLILNMKELYQQKKISLLFYVFIRLLNAAKYVRRIVICRVVRK